MGMKQYILIGFLSIMILLILCLLLRQPRQSIQENVQQPETIEKTTMETDNTIEDSITETEEQMDYFVLFEEIENQLKAAANGLTLHLTKLGLENEIVLEMQYVDEVYDARSKDGEIVTVLHVRSEQGRSIILKSLERYKQALDEESVSTIINYEEAIIEEVEEVIFFIAFKDKEDNVTIFNMMRDIINEK